MAKYIDAEGLRKAFKLIKENFVLKGEEKFTDAEKTKLAGIEANAQVNLIDIIKVNGTVMTTTTDGNNHKVVDITIPSVTADSIQNALGYAPVQETTVDTKVATAKSDLLEAIGKINTLKYKVVEVLPTVDEAELQTIYLVPITSAANGNQYIEYFVVGGQWEAIGNTNISLANYVTQDVLNSALETVADTYVKNTDFKLKLTEALTDEAVAMAITNVVAERLPVAINGDIAALFDRVY